MGDKQKNGTCERKGSNFETRQDQHTENKEEVSLENEVSDGTSDYRSGGEIRPTLVGTTDETSKVLNYKYSEAQTSLVVG